VQPGEHLSIDVTHGFRHLPMLALVAARYLGRVVGVKVEELYYGASK
jgi:CRISPR-associated DxTHG motif protein